MESSAEKFPADIAPQRDSDLGNDEVHAFIRAQIDRAMTPELIQAYRGNIPTQPLDFVQVLGADDNAHWWRLYINPKDWRIAQTWAASTPSDVPVNQQKPGYYYNWDRYDAEKPGEPLKNFHDPIVGAYKVYLAGRKVNGLFSSGAVRKFGPEEYYALWAAAKPEDPTGDKFSRKTGKSGSFQGARTLDPEVYGITFEIKDPVEVWSLAHLAGEHERIESWRAFLIHFADDITQYPMAGPTELTDGIQLVFDRFFQSMPLARTPEAQLKEIGSVIRSLHMFHAFSDGCGRCNVFTLLPLMLLNYGYGLPLGGEHGRGITRTTLHMLFNGGYSLDYIAKFLFVSQDKGLLDKHSVVYDE